MHQSVNYPQNEESLKNLSQLTAKQRDLARRIVGTTDHVESRGDKATDDSRGCYVLYRAHESSESQKLVGIHFTRVGQIVRNDLNRPACYVAPF